MMKDTSLWSFSRLWGLVINIIKVLFFIVLVRTRLKWAAPGCWFLMHNLGSSLSSCVGCESTLGDPHHFPCCSYHALSCIHSFCWFFLDVCDYLYCTDCFWFQTTILCFIIEKGRILCTRLPNLKKISISADQKEAEAWSIG